MQIHRLVVEIVDAAPDACHGGVEGVLQLLQRSVQSPVLAYRADGPCHEDGAGEHMSHIVVDFPGDPVPLFQCRGVHLGSPGFPTGPCFFFFQEKISLHACVPGRMDLFFQAQPLLRPPGKEQGGQAGGMSLCVDSAQADPRLILSAHVVEGLWLLQGGTVGGGGALNWFEREFAAAERAAAQEQGGSSFQQLDREAEAVPPGCQGLVFLPYLAGERSPLWDIHAKGVYYGIDFSKTRAHFARACMEGVAYSLRHNLEVAQEAGCACVLLAQGHQSRRRLEAAGVPVLESVGQVPAFLGAQKGGRA